MGLLNPAVASISNIIIKNKGTVKMNIENLNTWLELLRSILFLIVVIQMFGKNKREDKKQ
ncbi:hypothetical protein [Brachyspira hyodysenteriae]|uniref:hypothetical protein n=1 Tax=Brachyspira hyodysenteriae TaxID=159 RepID=UPI0022CD7015|nr:hypothetical protein [Brachyspira hyodysenteriae]MDA0051287.1 hypothetical protein [Brachyspira hyodysenteriae]MDA0051294.1 hypothetical protein [Brachyspira hyodysenteriae]MDA0051578.1 hypothetical protein [Brachyspira hyodysenteriae]MDA0051586.1 hypothetical protein [Brachyspira hyodysenteriae]MDA0051844.1 hypothetical protein [Brachyspira hyodysenteriae]